MADEQSPAYAEHAKEFVELAGHRQGRARQPDTVAPPGSGSVVHDARPSRPGPLVQRPVVESCQASARKEDHCRVAGTAAVDEQTVAGHGHERTERRRRYLMRSHRDRASSWITRLTPPVE